jgi:glycosyltransferase involved in cell wall biosynthesis
MRILFLTSRLPYAGIPGGLNLVYHRVTRLAARGHEVGLASFCSDEDRPKVPELMAQLHDVKILPPPKRRSWCRCGFDYFFLRVPPRYANLHDPEMYKLVGRMHDRSHYDVIIAEFSVMGQYLYHNPYLSAVRRVISCHHSTTFLTRQAMAVMGAGVDALHEWILSKSLARFEFDMYRSADRLLVLTPQERYSLLNEMPNLQMSIVPSAVDVEFFKPRKAETTEPCVLFTGHYDDESNEDAVLWFARWVWPHLKRRHIDLTFYVVGPQPTVEMNELARLDPRIILTGKVPDIRPYLNRASVFVCPIRFGSGLRVKVLEAMAAGVPVVSTTQGAEGIPVQMGDNCYLADDPRIMAQNISLLLDDLPLRQTIAEQARAMVKERFSWESSIDRLEEVLFELS